MPFVKEYEVKITVNNETPNTIFDLFLSRLQFVSEKFRNQSIKTSLNITVIQNCEAFFNFKTAWPVLIQTTRSSCDNSNAIIVKIAAGTDAENNKIKIIAYHFNNNEKKTTELESFISSTDIKPAKIKTAEPIVEPPKPIILEEPPKKIRRQNPNQQTYTDSNKKQRQKTTRIVDLEQQERLKAEKEKIYQRWYHSPYPNPDLDWELAAEKRAITEQEDTQRTTICTEEEKILTRKFGLFHLTKPTRSNKNQEISNPEKTFSPN